MSSREASAAKASPPYPDARLLRNVAEARDNGFDLVCAMCGCGMDDTEFEDDAAHDIGCPNVGRDRAAEMEAFIAKRLGLEDSGV